MGDVARLWRWEWFKLRRRWMPWILLAILLLFSQLGIIGSVFQYREFAAGGEVFVGGPGGGRPTTVECADVLAGRTEGLPPEVTPTVLEGLRVQCEQASVAQRQVMGDLYGSFAFPGSIERAVQTASAIAVLLVSVLTASTLGVEYGWGTMRTTLVRGTGRLQYLGGKLLLVVSAVLAALLVIALAAGVTSAIATAMVDAPEGGATTGAWADAAVAIARTVYGIVPFLAFVALITVLTASSATGMAAGIGYYIAEPILLALLGALFEWVEPVREYTLAANTTEWLDAGGVMRSGGVVESTAAGTQEFAVLLAYAVVFVVLSGWVIVRRDVAKATGT